MGSGSESSLLSRSFSSSLMPRFQNESLCNTFLMKMSLICMTMNDDTHFDNIACVAGGISHASAFVLVAKP